MARRYCRNASKNERTWWASALLSSILCQPVLEITGENLHIPLLHDVRGYCGRYFELGHRFLHSFPEAVTFGLSLSKVKLGNQFAELLEHDCPLVVIVVPYDVLLVLRVFAASHLYA